MLSVTDIPDHRTNGERFRDEENARAHDQSIKDREDRTLEINNGGVWLLGYKCSLCCNKMMLGGTKELPKVFCPRCNVQATEAFLKKEGFIK
jgi:hypothetical protein